MEKLVTVDESKTSAKEPHVLIINVDAKGRDKVELGGVEVTGSSETLNGEISTWTKTNIIINVVDSNNTENGGRFTGTVVATGSKGKISGSILAPDATVIADVNVNGQIIADKIVINAEFHRDSITFNNSITTRGGLKAKKTINGSSNLEEYFDFRITALGDSPAPEGAKEGEKSNIVQNEADGFVNFGYLRFKLQVSMII